MRSDHREQRQVVVDPTRPDDTTNGRADAQKHPAVTSDFADAEYVRKLYNLFLRRNPENETVIAENVGRTIADLFSRFLKSPEFNDKVLAPLASGQPLWGPYCGSGSFSDVRQWAKTALPIAPDVWGELTAKASWEDFYLALLLDESTWEFNDRLREPGVRRALELRRLDAELQINSRQVPSRLEDVADAEHVTRLYNLILRRDPENETVVGANVGRRIADILLALLTSPEFNNKVLCPLVSEEALWAPYSGSTRFLDLRRWAMTTLPIGPDFWEKLAPSASWESFYLALLLDGETRDFIPGLNEPSHSPYA